MLVFARMEIQSRLVTWVTFGEVLRKKRTSKKYVQLFNALWKPMHALERQIPKRKKLFGKFYKDSLLWIKNCGCHTIKSHDCGCFTYSRTIQCKTLTQVSRKCCDVWCVTQVPPLVAQVSQRLCQRICKIVWEYWSIVQSKDSLKWKSMLGESINESLCGTPNIWKISKM